MAPPKEITDGLYHWTAVHPDIKIKVHSHYLEPERVVIDALLPSPGGLAWLEKHGPPEHVILTSGLHWRHSAKLVEAFGCTLWVPRQGLRRLPKGLRARARARARAYDDGDTLPGKIRAVVIGVLCADEAALLIPRARALAVADGVVRWGNAAPIGFVPDELLVDDPRRAPRVKRGLKAAYRKLAQRRSWDHLLMAHGAPIVEHGRDTLLRWAKETP